MASGGDPLRPGDLVDVLSTNGGSSTQAGREASAALHVDRRIRKAVLDWLAGEWADEAMRASGVTGGTADERSRASERAGCIHRLILRLTVPEKTGEPKPRVV